MKTLLVLLSLASFGWAFGNELDIAEKLQKEIAKNHYDLALNLAKARDLNLTCELDAYEDSVIQQLFHAIRLNPEFEQIAANEPLLRKLFNSNLQYRELVGEFKLHIGWPNLSEVLPDAVFYGPAQGVYGHESEIRFAPNGKLKTIKLEVLDDEPWYTFHEIDGTWTINTDSKQQPQIEITDRDGKRVYILRKVYVGHMDYILVPIERKDEYRPVDSLTNMKSECEA